MSERRGRCIAELADDEGEADDEECEPDCGFGRGKGRGERG